MAKILLVVVGLGLALLLALASPFVYEAFKISAQQRALLGRSDYPQIATNCLALMKSITNHSGFIYPGDSRVPTSLRTLSFRYINSLSNHLRMEFHGGFDHYGYELRPSNTNANTWTLLWYTEKTRKPLTTIAEEHSAR